MEIAAAAAEFFASNVASELLQNLLQISATFIFCRGSAEDLKDTVNALVPVIEEIRGSGVEVPELRRSHIDQVSRRLQEGLEITRKILESPRYSVFRKFQLARKMEKLEKEISRFTRVIIQAHIWAEVSHMRSEGAESFHRLEGSNHRIERSLLEIKDGNGSRMAESLTEIQEDAEESWNSAHLREREKVAEGYPAEAVWATGGCSREGEKGGDGYAAENAWSISGHSREEAKDVEGCAGAEEDIPAVGISGLKCGLKKDSSV